MRACTRIVPPNGPQPRRLDYRIFCIDLGCHPRPCLSSPAFSKVCNKESGIMYALWRRVDSAGGEIFADSSINFEILPPGFAKPRHTPCKTHNVESQSSTSKSR